MTKELSLKEHLNSAGLFEAFKLQLKKDLGESGCDNEFVDHMLPELEMMQEMLRRQLHNYEKKAGFNLQQLLYRVDISEKQLSDRMKLNKGDTYLSIVAELIIKRVLQKIILKKYFSK